LIIPVGGSSGTSVTGTSGNKVCGPVNCRGKPKTCPYGYQKHDGCEICKCSDPCNPSGKVIILFRSLSLILNVHFQPILCGPKQRCFIDKKLDGTFSTRCGTPPPKKGKGEKKDSKGNLTFPANYFLLFCIFRCLQQTKSHWFM
jgi:hypothetical protein